MKLLVCLLAVAFAMSLSVFAQQDNTSQTQSDQSAAKAATQGYGQGGWRQVRFRQR